MKTFTHWIVSLTAIAGIAFAAPVAPPPSAVAAPAAAPTTAPAANAVFRVWTDNQGRKLDATFRGLQDGNIFLQVRDGFVHRLPLAKLSAEDQQIAATLKPEGLGIPTDPNLAQQAAKIDFLVNGGLAKAGQKPNPLATDEQFIRRVYLDIAGRIPTREEALEFITDSSVSKRAKVIDKLITSDGYKSHLFNYLADMLRVSDEANKARYYTYQDWLKVQLNENVPWDRLVQQMMTADGKLLDNGATGYLLRDAGMRLDNLSLTLSTFLGANVSCAQCHDHPFAEWTQHEFYQMAAFFGASETYGAKGSGKGMANKEMRQAIMSLPDKRLQQQAKNIARVNGLQVVDTEENDLKLPDDYKYKDAKPGDKVAPKLITWGKNDTHLRSYQEVKTKEPSELRDQFAKWMTSPENPRFAMTIANRMWKRFFGVGVREPVTDLDDVNASVNPALLQHLASEMVRVKFDLKAFTRLLCNTQCYQREATSFEPEAGSAYLFPGPTLRRMTAEQAWDSCSTLVVGHHVDEFKSWRGDKYAKAMSIDFTNPSTLADQITNAMQSMRSNGGGKGKANANVSAKKRRMMQQQQQPSMADEDADFRTTPPMLGGLVLARASELPQPEKDQHFLRQFGQSDRQIADSGNDEGSIPQVMMLMNGEAQSVISSNGSLVLKTATEQASQEASIESLYVSFFSRKPKPTEVAAAKEALAAGLALKDLTWVLFNTREFMFVE